MNPMIAESTILFYGTVSNNFGKRTYDSGKAVTNFSVAYGWGSVGNVEEKKTKYFSCSAWNNGTNRLADYASCLEKGDVVLILGQWAKKKDREGNFIKDANGTVRVEVRCDFISVQQQVEVSNDEMEELP